MNIGGVLVLSKPEHADAVSSELIRLDGVEVHAINENGRLVVTIEKETANELADTLTLFNDINGVLSATVIYHHAEDDVDTETDNQQVFNVEAPDCACNATATPEAI